MSPEEVVDEHNQVQGIFDKEFNEELVGMSNGIKMQEKMAERRRDREDRVRLNQALRRRFHIVYPGLEGEYTHGNKEAAHIRDGLKGRKGDRRFFFYIGERLWKIYDVVHVRHAEQQESSRRRRRRSPPSSAPPERRWRRRRTRASRPHSSAGRTPRRSSGSSSEKATDS